MRVGLNQKQHAQAKKMYKQGVSPDIIAKTFRCTAQSLENIIAHWEDRKPRRVGEATNSDEVNELKTENAELRARLAEFTEGAGSTGKVDDDGNPVDDEEDDD